MYLPEECKRKIISFLKKEFSPKFIYLFGSFAKGQGREESDIDVAIYTEEVMDGYTLLTAASHLSFEVNKDVQIVHLKDISTVFAAQIVGTREVLYCIDEKAMAYYNTRTLKDYAKLNEERSQVLERIEREGKIYG